jgi:hypothetical protein
MKLKAFITAVAFGFIATTSHAESDSELAAKVFFPSAEECAIQAQELDEFFASMTPQQKADYEKGFAKAMKESQARKSPLKDTFLADLKNKYGMSDREAVLAWVRRERSMNCH